MRHLCSFIYTLTSLSLFPSCRPSKNLAFTSRIFTSRFPSFIRKYVVSLSLVQDPRSVLSDLSYRVDWGTPIIDHRDCYKEGGPSQSRNTVNPNSSLFFIRYHLESFVGLVWSQWALARGFFLRVFLGRPFVIFLYYPVSLIWVSWGVLLVRKEVIHNLPPFVHNIFRRHLSIGES